MSVTARGPAREAWRREQLSKAHSASPRPQRFRAVDAVKLAKQELETTGPMVKAGRLRLASVLDDGSGRDTGPVLHDGFYKLAATVTRPEPSLRQKATNLQKSLEMQLERLRVAAGKDVQSLVDPPLDPDANTALPAIEGEKHSDTFITQEEPSVEASFGLQLVSAAPCESASTAISRAQLARQELELCVEILQSYARETSSDCRERRAFLNSTASTAAVSIQKLSEVVQRQSEEALDAERRIGELKAKITELEEDTDGLRRVVQQMLKDEAELRKQNEETVAEVNERQQQLTEAEHRSDHLSVQLHKAMEKIHLQEELQRNAKEKLRDGANSPMMHFTTFVLGPDQVPSGSAVNISGESNKVERTRTDKSHSGMCRSTSGHSTRNSLVSGHAGPAGHMPPELAGSQSNSQVLSRSVTPDMMAESSSDEDRNLPMVKKTSSRRQMSQESLDSEASAEPPRPSPLAVSFPALVPYLDFQKDAESNKIKAQTAALNQDHLEKHMMMLQEERQKHIEQNKLLQQAVDSTLERLLVWVQAAFDSLRDFGPQSVQQDATALATIRDMLAWLAERTCKAWIEASANLPQVLYSHEERVRQALELAEKDSSLTGNSRNEVEELRKALQEQTERVEELERQVQAAAQEHRASPSQGISALQAGSLEQDVADPAQELAGRSLSLDLDPERREVPATEMELPAEVGPEALEEVKETEDQQPEECDAGRAAALEAEQEAQRMRLFRCPFAEGVDLTYVKRDRQFPYSNMEDPEENKRLGRRQLRHWISEVYAAKRLEDRRRDKAKVPRRQMHFIMQEMLRRQVGVKSLVHQRSWQLLEAVCEHAVADVAVGLFADFLDGTRDLDELSFYLYCSHLIATVPEEAQVLPPSRVPMGYVSESRCLRLVELLFSDLPKAKTVVQEEIEKQVPLPGWAVGTVGTVGSTAMSSLEDLSYMSFDESLANTRCIEADALCRALLEGWRVCCLLLSKSMPHFSWRDTILAFIQADVHSRGWLDPHEVQKAEIPPAARKSRSLDDTVALTDHTSLGAFVFRIVQHLGGLTEASLKEDVVAETTALEFPGQKEQQICFQLCLAAFRSLERSLGVYLKWLLHSEEPRDRSVYRSVTGRIFAVRRAIRLGRAWPLMHNLRSLLVLLLSHQFDLQLTREEAQPEHVGWELTALLHVLRESWRRGASGVGPDFGTELEEVGENELRDEVPELPESASPQSAQSPVPLTGRERPPLGPSVSFTVGQKLACD